MRLLQALALISFALLGGFSFARADDYPSRPITLIVPFPPGGSTTVMARNVADKVSAALGQQIVVENRGGAGGLIGAASGFSLYAAAHWSVELPAVAVRRQDEPAVARHAPADEEEATC